MYKVLTAPTPCVTRFDEEIKSFKTQKAAITFAQECEEKNVAVWQGQGYMFTWLKLDGKVKHRYHGDFMGYELSGDTLGEITKQVKAACKIIKADGCSNIMEGVNWVKLCRLESKMYGPNFERDESDIQWLAHTVNKALPKKWQVAGEEVNKAFPFEL